MKMKAFLASHKHRVAFKDLTDAVDKHLSELTDLEILAIVSNMMGQLIAHQTIPRVVAMDIITKNVDAGMTTEPGRVQ